MASSRELVVRNHPAQPRAGSHIGGELSRIRAVARSRTASRVRRCRPAIVELRPLQLARFCAASSCDASPSSPAVIRRRRRARLNSRARFSPSTKPVRRSRQSRGYPGIHAGDDHALQGAGRESAQGADAGRVDRRHAGCRRVDGLSAVDHARGAAALPADGRRCARWISSASEKRCARRAGRSKGARRSLADWRGQVLAVTFVYTRCPLPNFCPLIDRHFAAVQEQVRSVADLRGRVRLVSVTLDPDTTRPRSCCARRELRADPAVWTCSPAIAGTDRTFASQFGVSVVREHATVRAGSQPADRDHRRQRPAGDDAERQRLDARRRWSRRSGMRAGDVDAPPLSAFTAAERRLIERLRTPAAVQRFLNELPYNNETAPAKHCAAFAASSATARRTVSKRRCPPRSILEQHGYPPLVLSFESIDELDHVIFVYRTPTGWGSVARSRDPGLHGRKPVFTTPRNLALSYVDPYVDFTGRVTGYEVVDLRVTRALRLAAVGHERVEGGADAARLAAPEDPHVEPRGSRGGGRATRRSGGSTRRGSRSTTRAAIAGRRCRRSSRGWTRKAGRVAQLPLPSASAFSRGRNRASVS